MPTKSPDLLVAIHSLGAGVAVLLAVWAIIVGIGLLYVQEWARLLMLVSATVALAFWIPPPGRKAKDCIR